jgi:hypothetical protein
VAISAAPSASSRRVRRGETSGIGALDQLVDRFDDLGVVVPLIPDALPNVSPVPLCDPVDW